MVFVLGQLHATILNNYANELWLQRPFLLSQHWMEVVSHEFQKPLDACETY